VAFARWLRIGWLIVAADFLYWISGLAYRGEEQPMSDWHATFNTVTYFGGWILVGLLVLGELIAWAVKPRER
jgi:hypothetical protein